MDCNGIDISKTYLVTGAAGFIGFHLSKYFLERGCKVVGIDNMNEYYDVNLKEARLEKLLAYDKYININNDISDKLVVLDTFKRYRPQIVINLAAQAGVRYSIENPDVYIQSNIVGFFNILEACRHYPVDHLIYASSSSVYGSNKRVPFEESDNVDHPISLYAATKKSNELVAYTYSHLFKVPTTGLRFFTVYGPFGRPDMAYFGFLNNHFNEKPIRIYNNGKFDNDLSRDFTYVDDVVDGIARLVNNPPDDSNDTPYNIYNIGNNKPESLMDFIEALERALSIELGREIVFNKKFEELKAGDVPITYASIDSLQKAVGFKPKTSINEGLREFVKWYVEFYGVK